MGGHETVVPPGCALERFPMSHISRVIKSRFAGGNYGNITFKYCFNKRNLTASIMLLGRTFTIQLYHSS